MVNPSIELRARKVYSKPKLKKHAQLRNITFSQENYDPNNVNLSDMPFTPVD